MISSGELVAEVLHNLDMDNDAEAQEKFDVYNKLNEAQRAILRNAPVSQVDNILKTVTGNLQNGLPYYQWPSDFVRLSDLFVDYETSITDTNPGVEAIMPPSGVFQIRNLDLQPSKTYPAMFYVDGGFELRPIPDRDVTDGFMLRYVYEPPAISATQDSLLRNDLRSALVFKATSLCAMVNSFDLNMADRYEALFQQEIKGLWSENKDLNRG